MRAPAPVPVLVLVLLGSAAHAAPSATTKDRAPVGTPAAPPAFQVSVQCGLIYLSDMKDMNTLQRDDAGTLTVTSTTAVRGFVPLAKQSHGFKVAINLDPLVSDDATFARGFDVTIQLDKGDATAYGSTHANVAEPFRRLSVIIGVGKEQVTANCDISPHAAPHAAPHAP